MKKLSIIFLSIVLVACGNAPHQEIKTGAHPEESTVSDAGKDLFFSKCATCHGVNSNLTGPALAGVENRWQNKETLYAFIRNSKKVIATDGYAKDLFNQWHGVEMTPFPALKDDEIASLLNYINQSTRK